MKIILLSGGSGTRLWPLSNDSRSKQFLKIISKPDKELESMVQRIWRQLDLNGLLDSVYISTNKQQMDVIHNQLGSEVPLIIEPERRDTFPAISLVASYLYSVEKVDPLDVMIVMPVDSYVENKFFDKIKDLERAIEQLDVDILLMGVNPSSASAKYGYIIPEKTKRQTSMKVTEFKEKPTEMEAERLLKQNVLWNCGVFAFRLGYIIEQLEKRGLPTDFTEAVQHYERFPKISFDYEIVEKAEKIAVIPYDGYWEDLGTWDALTGKMDMSEIGKVTKSDDCFNTHIINELDIPIILLGTSNTLITASPDGILVADKEKSHRIKEMVKDLNGFKSTANV